MPDMSRRVNQPPTDRYATLRRLGELGAELERRRGPDPYPRPTGPAPTLQELRQRADEINQIAARHGARSVHVFGSVARGETRPDSDLDILVDLGEHSTLLKQTALQGDLEDLLGCPVHVTTTSGLNYATEETCASIEHDAVAL